MTPKNVAHIVRERLDKWGTKLIVSHATPVVLIGLGHDHAAGRASVCYTDAFDHGGVIQLLEEVIRLLRAQEERG